MAEGRQVAAQFSVECMVEGVEEVYRKVLSDDGRWTMDEDVKRDA